MNEVTTKKASLQRRGLVVFIILAVLTILEFLASTAMSSPNLILTLIALGKAYLIISYFMHLAQLWREEA